MTTAADTTATAGRGRGDAVKDVLLWRRKERSMAALAASTAAWAAMEVFGYTFLTVASWSASPPSCCSSSAATSRPFLGGPDLIDLSKLYISEHTAVESANAVRIGFEDYLRRTIRIVVVDKDVLAFSGQWPHWTLSTAAAPPYPPRLVAGVLLSLTGPAVYLRHEESIRGFTGGAMDRGRRFCEVFDEKVTGRLKNRKRPAKEKKSE
ncbi:unnamed protein product [Spirodela intermedia]|uniref:Reticulon-like protein n=1 Tax=Spirodela intermedia TaxID=51605 RepID=A0A7I8IIS3_SPIIN|nr:unnamed protein product [Spirodela intermedia]CAA6657775.1 unnamed protein product [Spirodela intermedia]